MSYFIHRGTPCPRVMFTFIPCVSTTKQEIVFDDGYYKEVTKSVEIDLRDIANGLTYHDFGLMALKKSGAIQYLKTCQFSDCSVDKFIESITNVQNNPSKSE